MNSEIGNPWERMLLVGANIIDQNKCQIEKKQDNHLARFVEGTIAKHTI
jgi:hypothetical protein